MTIRRSSDDGGFTLVELVITIVIMGIITIPLGNFTLAYFKNYTETQARLGDSHDVQIAAAYFSQDIAGTGLRSAPTATPANDPQQSVWTAPTGTYCGSGSGTAVLLLKWDDWTVSGGSGSYTGSAAVHSVAYVAQSGTLRRVYCASGSATTSATTVVHNLVYPDGANATPVTCSTNCTASTAPGTVSLKLSIRGDTDTSISYVTLSGQRRQSSS
jgi:prepilin-type N-terminal cleavage/methylation domain-containing protein